MDWDVYRVLQYSYIWLLTCCINSDTKNHEVNKTQNNKAKPVAVTAISIKKINWHFFSSISIKITNIIYHSVLPLNDNYCNPRDVFNDHRVKTRIGTQLHPCLGEKILTCSVAFTHGWLDYQRFWRRAISIKSYFSFCTVSGIFWLFFFFFFIRSYSNGDARSCHVAVTWTII